MWIFTKHGFISAVQDRERPGIIIVRARSKKHLTDIIGNRKYYAPQPQHTPKNDYPWRVFLHASIFSMIVGDLALSIDYHNFKGSLTDQDYHLACLNVWSEMRAFQRDHEDRNNSKHARRNEEFFEEIPIPPKGGTGAVKLRKKKSKKKKKRD